MNYEEIGNFIAKLRHEKNLTQKELAIKIGVTDKAVSKWERGLGCPDVSILEDLSSVLDVSILEILKGRRIYKEELEHEDINEYVLETIDYSKKEINRKIKKLILNTISILIIAITSFLLLININHIAYLSVKYPYMFDEKTMEEIKNDLNSIEGNLKVIKSNQGIFNSEEYQKIVTIIEERLNYYNNMDLLKYKGEKYFHINDIYLQTIYESSYLSKHEVYRILSKYDKRLETNATLLINNQIINLTLSNKIISPYTRYEYKLFNRDEIFNPIQIKMIQIETNIKEILQMTQLISEVGDIHE